MLTLDRYGRMGAVKRLVAILVGLTLLCACSVKKHLERVQNDVTSMYAETKDLEKLPLRSITWNQAVSMLSKNNMQIMEASSSISGCSAASL